MQQGKHMLNSACLMCFGTPTQNTMHINHHPLCSIHSWCWRWMWWWRWWRWWWWWWWWWWWGWWWWWCWWWCWWWYLQFNHQVAGVENLPNLAISGGGDHTIARFAFRLRLLFDGWWWMMMNDDGWWLMMLDDDGWWWMMMNDDGWWWMMMDGDGWWWWWWW